MSYILDLLRLKFYVCVYCFHNYKLLKLHLNRLQLRSHIKKSNVI